MLLAALRSTIYGLHDAEDGGSAGSAAGAGGSPRGASAGASGLNATH